MKTENLYIECESLEQTNSVLAIGLKHGLVNSYPEYFIDGKNGSCVRVMCGQIFTIDWTPKDFDHYLTYTQFMEKYAMKKFKEAVAKAKDKFNVDNTGLSRMLGYHRDYINEALKDGRSTKWQEKTIAKIEALSKGVVLDKITVEIDAKVSPELQKIIDETKLEVEKVSKENTQLKKDKEQLVIHNGKSEDLNFNLNKQIITLQRDKADLVKKLSDSQIEKNDLGIELHDLKKDNLEKQTKLINWEAIDSNSSDIIESLRQDKDSLKGQIRSLEKINARYKNKYAASVTIGLMIASVLICIILWGGV